MDGQKRSKPSMIVQYMIAQIATRNFRRLMNESCYVAVQQEIDQFEAK
jgi:hypothetical protein